MNLKYFTDKSGVIFEFEPDVLVLQPEDAIPETLPKGKTKIFKSQEKLTPYDFKESKIESKETIDDLKNQLLEEIKQKRKIRENSGIDVNGHHWGSDLKDEIRLTSALKFFDVTGSKEIPDWKLSSDVTISLTPDLAANVLSNLMTHYDNAFKWEEQKIKEISALKTLKSLKAYKEQGKLDT